jgi:hypothetical protein
LGDAATGVDLDVANRLEIVANGTSLRAFVNGTERLSVTDSTLGGAGAPGIFTSSAGVGFDDFSVTPP